LALRVCSNTSRNSTGILLFGSFFAGNIIPEKLFANNHGRVESAQLLVAEAENAEKAVQFL
jgi:hypothetical protein